MSETITITGYLYKSNKLLLCGAWEDLIDFVEELKKINTKWIDRRDFEVKDFEGFSIKKWLRK